MNNSAQQGTIVEAHSPAFEDKATSENQGTTVEAENGSQETRTHSPAFEDKATIENRARSEDGERAIVAPSEGENETTTFRMPAHFKNGDRLENTIKLPNFAVRGIDKIPRVTVMIANPCAGHYLVGEEDEKEREFSRAGGVELRLYNGDSKLVSPSTDEGIREKVWQFINQYDKMEFGHVKIWPKLETLNAGYSRFSFVVEPNQVGWEMKAVFHPRAAIRLTGPKNGTALVFPVYAATLPPSPASPTSPSSFDEKVATAGDGIVAEGAQPIDHGDPLWVDLAFLCSIKKDLYSSLAPALVYLPHGHTCADNSMEFAPSGPACGPEDLEAFKKCFMRAHDKGKDSGVTREQLRALDSRTLDLQFPNGRIACTQDSSEESRRESKWINELMASATTDNKH